MAQVSSIDSNATGLRIAEESSIGVLPATPNWVPYEPNSYEAFGGEITTVARNPINEGRQRQKGVVTDLDASGGFQTDLTQGNLQDILQGFFFADFRRKGEDLGPLVGGSAGVTFTPVTFTAANATEQLNITTHGLLTGDGPFHLVAGGGVLPTGLSADTEYWIIRIDADNVQLAASRANAVASTPVPVAFSDDGTPDAGRLLQRRVSIDGTNEYVYLNDSSGFVAGSLVFLTGRTNSGNNGLKTVTAVAEGRITVSENLVDEAVSGTTADAVVVGYQAAAGDIDMDASSDLPVLTFNTADATTLGLIPGEPIFIGGDTATTSFPTNAANNGFARVRSIAASGLTLDKAQGTAVTEALTTETIQVFFARILKNEATAALIKRRTYQLERTLGAPDDALLSQVQSEYLVGAVPSQLTMNINTGDKITVDLQFVGTDSEQRTGATGVKSGDRPALSSGDAFNTSSDFSRLKMNVIDSTSENPSSLFAFLSELTLTINNNVSPNKAVSVLGAFEVTSGQFNVEGSATAYFSDVAAITAVRNNSDVTLDAALVKTQTIDNASVKQGIYIDVPLIALGDGRPNIEQDQPITLPLTMPAAADRTFNHTLLMAFFDYLPDAADT